MNKIISLNLLSPEEKKEAATKRNYILLRNSLILLFVTTSFVALLLIGSRLLLLAKSTETHNQVSLVNPTEMQTRQQVANYNKILINLKTIQDDYIPWSIVVWDILEDIPNDITITQISFDMISENIVIEGNANRREDLLNLEQILKEEELLASPYIPLKNKLKKTNIDFIVTADLVLAGANLYEK